MSLEQPTYWRIYCPYSLQEALRRTTLLYSNHGDMVTESQAQSSHQDTASAYPGGLHLHVPLGPDDIVFVGGHWDPRTGTEPRVPRPESPVEKMDVTVMDKSYPERSKATQCTLL